MHLIPDLLLTTGPAIVCTLLIHRAARRTIDRQRAAQTVARGVSARHHAGTGAVIDAETTVHAAYRRIRHLYDTPVAR